MTCPIRTTTRLASWFVLMLVIPAVLYAEGEPPPSEDPRRGGSSPSQYVLDVDRAAFDAEVVSQGVAGLDLVDIEILWNGSQERYSAIFFPVSGTVHTLIQGTPSAWTAFHTAMAPLDGRFLDVEVAYFGGSKKYSAIFLEDGDDYAFALHTTNSDASFQARLEEKMEAGMSIVDFESYVDGAGNVKYAGVWAADPNQPVTHLFYGLNSAEFSDLLNPLAGRVIDIERYPGPSGIGTRYAMIVAQYDGGGWGVYRGQSAAGIGTRHGQISDADTHIIDIDFFESAGTYYNAVWGDAPKGLHVVAGIPSEPDPQTISASLQALIDNFESSPAGQSGVIGIYARNLRSDQSISYRANLPSYLASLSKVTIHTKLFREVEANRLAWASTSPYTNGVNRRDSWFVDDRSGSDGPVTASVGLGAAEFGQSFSLARYDLAMMEVSDNAATSLLVDDAVYGVANDAENLNEWVASIPGVGQEFGLVTSIQDVDRFLLWQGQQDPLDGYLNETSYLSLPPSAVSAYLRENDQWCDLSGVLSIACQDWSEYPDWSSATGRKRYQTMGLNSATPRAVGNFIEKLWEGDFLNTANTTAALNVMWRNPPGQSSTQLDNHPAFPAQVRVLAKGGSKTSWDIRTEGGLLGMGPDAVSIVLLTRDNSRPATGCTAGADNDVACDFWPNFSWQLLQELGSDLVVSDSTATFSPSTVSEGQPFDASCLVFNNNGGDTEAFDVTFYASSNTFISPSDTPIGTVRVAGVNGFGAVSADLHLSAFPDHLPVGDYNFGCYADPRAAGDLWGEVGEIDESDTSNNSAAASTQLSVVPDSTLFVDGFESGDVDEWSGSN